MCIEQGHLAITSKQASEVGERWGGQSFDGVCVVYRQRSIQGREMQWLGLDLRLFWRPLPFLNWGKIKASPAAASAAGGVSCDSGRQT